MLFTGHNRVVFAFALNWSERGYSVDWHLGGYTKKEQGIHKEECKKLGWPFFFFLYGRVPLDRHTQTKLMKQQERRLDKATL